VYFLNWDLTLPICHCCTSCHFHGWCYSLSCKLWKTYTYESEHMYIPLWIHVLLALVLLYFPLDNFITFLAYLCGICTFKTEHLYFLHMIYHFSSISRERCTSEIEHFVLPDIITYTTRSHSFVFPYIIAYTFQYYCIYFPIA
jgi:hypothetical protein